MFDPCNEQPIVLKRNKAPKLGYSSSVRPVKCLEILRQAILTGTYEVDAGRVADNLLRSSTARSELSIRDY